MGLNSRNRGVLVDSLELNFTQVSCLSRTNKLSNLLCKIWLFCFYNSILTVERSYSCWMPARYVCRSCAYKTVSALSYMKHCRVHSHDNSIPCGIPSCTKIFRKLSSFYSHISRQHSNLSPRNSRGVVQNACLTVTCTVPECAQVLNLNDLVKHLKGHIACGMKIACPVVGCGRLMAVKSTFTSHMSVKHGQLTRLHVDSAIIQQETPLCFPLFDDHPECDIDVQGDNLSTANSFETATDADGYGIDKENVLMELASFFLKLQCRLFVPVSTIQTIVTEFANLHQLGLENTAGILKNRLSARTDISEAQIDALISEIKDDYFHSALNSDDGILTTQHKRCGYYKQYLRYVEPIEVQLGDNVNGRKCSYHYIPIKNTLTSLMKDKTVADCIMSPNKSQPGIFEDLCDGDVVKNISKTVISTEGHNTSFCELVLYQDAFEIVNPLGSARTLHKLVGVYLALANLPCHVRTNIDSLQLVLLCREKDLNYFGESKVFTKMLDDLKSLESDGIEINGKNFAVRLVSMLGDNLGSHWIGGFCTNFSNSQFYCRYCLSQRDVHGLGATADVRTVDNYNNCIPQLTADKSVQGITKQSVLHTLQYFHVCMPGLPPCLGHDLFEGVVQYDVALILKYLCKTKRGMASYEHLNKVIQQFQFKGADANDKPRVVSTGHTVGGHAVQNWCLLRMLPLFMFDVIDTNDDIWKLLLLLREVVELICAPKISLAQILYLNGLVKIYLEDRSHLFADVPLRPKHHYLLHYPWLIMQLGPLIRVWTMRMESKHTFFKRCARASKNFINVTKTLAETHQLSQAYLSVGPMLKNDINLGSDATLFDEQLYSSHIVSVISACAKLIQPLHVSVSLTFKGTCYKKEDYVVLGINESQPVFGKVLMCFEDSYETHGLVVMVCVSYKVGELGLYMIKDFRDQQHCKCVQLRELWDYYPLCSYNLNGIPHIALKHALFDPVS